MTSENGIRGNVKSNGKGKTLLEKYLTRCKTYSNSICRRDENVPNEFTILDSSDNTTTNAEPCQETLKYNTVYWWRVRTVIINFSGGIAATGPWYIQMFTIVAAK